MNRMVELKGNRFNQESKHGGGGGPTMNGRVTVQADHIERLIEQLIQIREFWKVENRPFKGILISVHYNKVVAKSNRIAGLFKGKASNGCIVGAKFNEKKTQHIITYCIDELDLEHSIELLEDANSILKRFFNGHMGKVCHENKKTENFPTSIFRGSKNSKSSFRQVLADVSYIDSFDINRPILKETDSIITLYDVDYDIKLLFQNIGVDILSSRILDKQSVYLNTNQLKILLEKMPYLVAMSTVDVSTLIEGTHENTNNSDTMTIPSPTTEPVIGVIDTLFDSSVYFNEWVDFHDMISSDIPRTQEDYKHGTAVSSIIVDGPRLNPWLEDKCGRFKVRHFGVATGSKFSSFSIIKHIKSIVLNNPDIKVWNLSLGSNHEIDDNFISAESAILDQIQYENDVIFVIAGTNRPNDSIVKIGSPADSINSLVVNAVTSDGVTTDYSRRGLALSFYAKPDISYYGGSKEQYIRVCEPLGEAFVSGTSYAAPWIARKLSYLIDILGFRREVAKALIIDSARGWNEASTPDQIAVYGHGIVPLDINKIIQTNNDEIRFVVSDVSEKWNTYNYKFPVPIHNDKYPYIARATMCYFPLCNRAQGVDYTNTELNLHFGRLDEKGKINEINDDKQNQDDEEGNSSYIFEGDARKQYRKWDNVKYIVESSNKKLKAKKAYNDKYWGMEIKTNNRLDPKDGYGIRFGVVVTLKEINGVNRFDEFIRNCSLNGWLTNIVDIKERVEIHQKLNEEIELR